MRDGPGWGWVMAYGVFTLILAAVAFLWPVPATITAVVMADLLIASAADLVAAWRHRGRHRVFDTIMGVLSVVVGVWMILQAVGGELSLTIFIAIFLAIRGVGDIYRGVRGARRKGWVIALGVLNLLLAALIFGLLADSALTLPGTIVSITFLFTGIGAVGAALAIRRGDDPRQALPA